MFLFVFLCILLLVFVPNLKFCSWSFSEILNYLDQVDLHLSVDAAELTVISTLLQFFPPFSDPCLS